MKRTQRKDALRNIGRQKVSYLSIVVIALLGVTMFLGMNYSAAAIGKNGTGFYNDVHFRDMEIISTRLLSPEDMDVLRGIEGVQDVEGIVMTQAKAGSGTSRKSVIATTYSQRINCPMIVEGQLPHEAGSCAVEENLAQQMGWKVGDRVEITDSEGKQALFLKDRQPGDVLQDAVLPVCRAGTDDQYESLALSGKDRLQLRRFPLHGLRRAGRKRVHFLGLHGNRELALEFHIHNRFLFFCQTNPPGSLPRRKNSRISSSVQLRITQRPISSGTIRLIRSPRRFLSESMA